MGEIWQWTDALAISGFLLGAGGCVWLSVRAYAATGSVVGLAPGVPPSEMRGKVRRAGPLSMMGLGIALCILHVALTAPERGSAADLPLAEALRRDALLFAGFFFGLWSAVWLSVRAYRATGHPMGIVTDAEAAQSREPVSALGPNVLLGISMLLLLLHAVISR